MEICGKCGVPFITAYEYTEIFSLEQKWMCPNCFKIKEEHSSLKEVFSLDQVSTSSSKNGSHIQQPLLIVFDLDETLVNSIPTRFVKSKYCSKYISHRLDDDVTRTFLRPFAIELLQLINERGIPIAIWSVGQKPYVLNVTNWLQNLIGFQFFRVLHREHCKPKIINSNGVNIIVKANTKPLRSEFPEADFQHVILIDDKLENAYKNKNKFCLVPPFEVRGDDKGKTHANYFRFLVDALEKVSSITPSHFVHFSIPKESAMNIHTLQSDAASWLHKLRCAIKNKVPTIGIYHKKSDSLPMSAIKHYAGRHLQEIILTDPRTYEIRLQFDHDNKI